MNKKTKTKQSVGETAFNDIKRWAEDYINKLLFKKVG